MTGDPVIDAALDRIRREAAGKAFQAGWSARAGLPERPWREDTLLEDETKDYLDRHYPAAGAGAEQET